MDKIILNDGTTIEGGVVSPAGNKQIFISIPGNDIIRAVSLFSDYNKVEEIIFFSSIYKRVYKGYTQLGSVAIYDDEIQLYMNGESGSVKTTYTVPEEYLPEEMRTKGLKSYLPTRKGSKHKLYMWSTSTRMEYSMSGR